MIKKFTYDRCDGRYRILDNGIEIKIASPATSSWMARTIVARLNAGLPIGNWTPYHVPTRHR